MARALQTKVTSGEQVAYTGHGEKWSRLQQKAQPGVWRERSFIKV